MNVNFTCDKTVGKKFKMKILLCSIKWLSNSNFLLFIFVVRKIERGALSSKDHS